MLLSSVLAMAYELRTTVRALKGAHNGLTNHRLKRTIIDVSSVAGESYAFVKREPWLLSVLIDSLSDIVIHELIHQEEDLEHIYNMGCNNYAFIIYKMGHQTRLALLLVGGYAAYLDPDGNKNVIAIDLKE